MPTETVQHERHNPNTIVSHGPAVRRPKPPLYAPIGDAVIAGLDAAGVKARLATANAALAELKGPMIPFWRVKDLIRRDIDLLVRRGLPLGAVDGVDLRAALLADMRAAWLQLSRRYGDEPEFLRLAATFVLERARQRPET